MLSKLIGSSGEVEFDAVIDESVSAESRVTENAVEEGVDVADHVQLKAETIPISGVIVGEFANEKLEQLKRFQQNGELLTFLGIEIAEQVVIENMTRRRTAIISDGFEFSLKLRKIRIVKMQQVKIAVPARTVNKTQIKPKTKKGKKQPKKKTPKQPKASPKASKSSTTSSQGFAGLEGRK